VVSLVLDDSSNYAVQKHVNLVGWSLGLKVSLHSGKNDVSERLSVDLDDRGGKDG